VAQAQQIVQEIRQQLGEFDFEPVPTEYHQNNYVFK